MRGSNAGMCRVIAVPLRHSRLQAAALSAVPAAVDVMGGTQRVARVAAVSGNRPGQLQMLLSQRLGGPSKGPLAS